MTVCLLFCKYITVPNKAAGFFHIINMSTNRSLAKLCGDMHRQSMLYVKVLQRTSSLNMPEMP